MNKKKAVFENNFSINEEQMDSLARVLFPLVYDYLSSVKGAEKDADNTDDTKNVHERYLVATDF